MKRIILSLAAACLVCCAWAHSMTPRDISEDPVVIMAPDTFINKAPISFTDQGVTINVSSGSAYNAQHSYNNLGITYFACLANASMTISAQTPIQGIAVNGWVRKNFSASCDYGTIDYLSDSYDDTTGEPVLTISDINHTSVTITCNNQLRCFSVEIYFSSNPGGVQGEVQDTMHVAAVTAMALDYSEDTAFSQEGAYSYWLMLAPENGYPQLWLDMYAAVQGDLSGEYSMVNFNVGDYTYVQRSEDELDYEYAYDQEFTITSVPAGYHIEGWLIDDTDVLYEFVYEGLIPLTPAAVQSPFANHQMRKCENAKIIRNGQLLIEHNGKLFNAQGTEVK